MKGAARLRSAVEGLLLAGAPTSDALLHALSQGVAAVEATTNPVPKVVVSRAISAVDKYAEKRSSGAEETATPDLAIITARASRAELARLVAAFLSLLDAGGGGLRVILRAGNFLDEQVVACLREKAEPSSRLDLLPCLSQAEGTAHQARGRSQRSCQTASSFAPISMSSSDSLPSALRGRFVALRLCPRRS